MPQKLIFIVFLLLMASGLHAQMVLIQDPDGYTNMRSKPEKQGKIINRVPHGRVCMLMDEFAPVSSETAHWNWIGLGNYYPASDASWKYQPDPPAGYVHDSRFKRLEDLPSLTPRPAQGNCQSFGNNSLRVEVCTREFQPSKHRIKKDGGVLSIDGHFIWGMDGGVPKTEISRITIHRAGHTWKLPVHAFRNTYQPNLDRTGIYLGPDGSLYIIMDNGDGAGAYSVVWAWKDQGLLYSTVFEHP